MNREPFSPVTEEEVGAYARDGVVCLRGVFDADWVDLIREGIERNLREPGEFANFYDRDGDGHVFLNDVVSWRRIEEYRRYIFESPAPAIAARLMGSSQVNIFYDSAFYRTAGTTTPTPWHQDVPYWCIEGEDVCSLWMPIDPVGEDSALEFVAGSHRWDSVFYRESFFAEGAGTHSFETARGAAPDIEALRDDHDILSWDMEPGDCIVFHALTLHGSPGNQSTSRRRRAFATRWCGDDAVYTIRKGMSKPIVDPGIEPGEPMDCELFPVVWQR